MVTSGLNSYITLRSMKKNLGFTLIELMTTIVIIGILATVAVPTYQDFVEKSKTAEAHTTFSAIA